MWKVNKGVKYSRTSIIRTCFPGPIFCMNINKMWFLKIETIKSSLIFPNACLKINAVLTCFGLKKKERAGDELIILMHSAEFWLAQFYCDVAKGMSCLIPHWLCKYKTNWSQTQITAMSMQRKQSVLSLTWRKAKKEQI